MSLYNSHEIYRIYVIEEEFDKDRKIEELTNKIAAQNKDIAAMEVFK